MLMYVLHCQYLIIISININNRTQAATRLYMYICSMSVTLLVLASEYEQKHENFTMDIWSKLIIIYTILGSKHGVQNIPSLGQQVMFTCSKDSSNTPPEQALPPILRYLKCYTNLYSL